MDILDAKGQASPHVSGPIMLEFKLIQDISKVSKHNQLSKSEGVTFPIYRSMGDSCSDGVETGFVEIPEHTKTPEHTNNQ